MPMLNIMLTILLILIGVAFITLMERKILSYIQNRKWPNKVSLIGIIQPFSDAIKLFFKEQTLPLMSNYMIYITGPIIGLFNALLVWSISLFWLIVFHLILVFYFIFFLLY